MQRKRPFWKCRLQARKPKSLNIILIITWLWSWIFINAVYNKKTILTRLAHKLHYKGVLSNSNMMLENSLFLETESLSNCQDVPGPFSTNCLSSQWILLCIGQSASLIITASAVIRSASATALIHVIAVFLWNPSLKWSSSTNMKIISLLCLALWRALKLLKFYCPPKSSTSEFLLL